MKNKKLFLLTIFVASFIYADEIVEPFIGSTYAGQMIASANYFNDKTGLDKMMRDTWLINYGPFAVVTPVMHFFSEYQNWAGDGQGNSRYYRTNGATPEQQHYEVFVGMTGSYEQWGKGNGDDTGRIRKLTVDEARRNFADLDRGSYISMQVKRSSTLADTLTFVFTSTKRLPELKKYFAKTPNIPEEVKVELYARYKGKLDENSLKDRDEDPFVQLKRLLQSFELGREVGAVTYEVVENYLKIATSNPTRAAPDLLAQMKEGAKTVTPLLGFKGGVGSIIIDPDGEITFESRLFTPEQETKMPSTVNFPMKLAKSSSKRDPAVDQETMLALTGAFATEIRNYLKVLEAAYGEKDLVGAQQHIDDFFDEHTEALKKAHEDIVQVLPRLALGHYLSVTSNMNEVLLRIKGIEKQKFERTFLEAHGINALK
jgi:hypothetical protein